MKSARRPARALPKTRSPSTDPSVTPGPKKSDARPMATRTRPTFAAASSSAVMEARVRPLTVVAASGRSSVIAAPRPGRNRTGSPGSPAPALRQRPARHAAAGGRVPPLGVRGAQALVDDQRAFGGVRGGFRVGQSAGHHSTPSSSAGGRWRETARTGRPSLVRCAASALPTWPVPNTTCRRSGAAILSLS